MDCELCRGVTRGGVPRPLAGSRDAVPGVGGGGASKVAYLLYVESTLRSPWEQRGRRSGWGSGHREPSPQAEAGCSLPALTLAWSMDLRARPFARVRLTLPVPGVLGCHP